MSFETIVKSVKIPFDPHQLMLEAEKMQEKHPLSIVPHGDLLVLL